MSYRQYVNLCVGHKNKLLRQDTFNRDLLYNTIKGWADPKKFTYTKERFWPLEGDSLSLITMPTPEEIAVYDERFRSLGSKKKWQE